MFPGQKIQLLLNAGAGTTSKILQPFHDLFSDGDPYKETCPGNSPVEVVPTPDKILCLNRYFRKIAVLIRKKPCNLAGFGWAGKMAQYYRSSGAASCFRNTMLPENKPSSRAAIKKRLKPKKGDIMCFKSQLCPCNPHNLTRDQPFLSRILITPAAQLLIRSIPDHEDPCHPRQPPDNPEHYAKIRKLCA